MLNINNINQQSPNFQARVKMSKTGKLGEFLKEKGINSNKALIGSAGLLGSSATAVMASPNLISAPVAAKYGIFGGMASTMGLMVRNIFRKSKLQNVANKKTVSNIAQEAAETIECSLVKNADIKFSDKQFGKFRVSQKGLKQFRELRKEYANASAKFYDYDFRLEHCFSNSSEHVKNRAVAKEEMIRLESELELLKQLGELP